MANFVKFEEKMQAAGVREAAIKAFERCYEKLVGEVSGMMPEASLEPADQVTGMESLPQAEHDPELLKQAVVIKLNGGLGTSMGLQKAKSLLEVRDGDNFLDLIVRQTLSLRETTGEKVRFLLMNSFSTSADTLSYLSRYAGDKLSSADEVELMQNQVPKIDAASLEPATCSADPTMEWCPPGHGDLYAALMGSGWLDRLLDQGVRYAFVSNSDNLGAVLDERILRSFAESGAPFLMEVTRRTGSDRKGGHLARRKSDGRLVLREVAQCPEEDLETFQDIERYQFFNTNNLWLRLDHLKEAMEREGGFLPLPMIQNRKTVDPRDKASTAVFQLETAMGAAIECFDGAGALEVARTRFAPVKSTGDLLALRSDAYGVLVDGSVALIAERAGVPPVIKLSDEYKLVDAISDLGVPSLREASSLEVCGAFDLDSSVKIVGEVKLVNESGQRQVLRDRVIHNETLVF
jgi:UTP--glucose-1-phosphate uridylyltransferase